MGEFVLFADGNIFDTGKDEKSAYLKANIVLEKVHEYNMYSNQPHINTEKSCYMHIHPSLNSTARLTSFARSRPLNCGLQLKIGSKKIKKEPNVKFLGVIIDD